MNRQSKPNGGILTRFALWLFSWRGARALLISAAWFLTIVALLYAIENWRGNREWQAVRQDLEKRGEELSFRRLLEHNIPPDQNFFATPFIAAALSSNNVPSDRFTWARDIVPASRKGTQRRHTDLVAWAQAFKATEAGPARLDLERSPAPPDAQARAEAARTILRALSEVEPGTSDLQAMLSRPHARFPVNESSNPYDAPPFFAIIRNTAQRVELEACAHLAAGNPEAALQGIVVGVALANSVREEPYFVAQLVRMAVIQLMLQPIWEGLVDHRWNKEQLDRLDAHLSKINTLPDLDRAVDAERAAGILTVDLVRDHGDVVIFDESEGARNEWLRRFFVKALPDGWFAMEKANFCRNLDALFAGVDVTNRTVSPKVLSEARAQLGSKTPAQALRTHQVASRMLLPALSAAAVRFTVTQAHVDMSRIAIQMEKQRLDRGTYPASLSQLDPDGQLPREVIPGHPPYRYQLQDQGYLLYSIGWDLDDDLGNSVGRDASKEGDWVWGHLTR